MRRIRAKKGGEVAVVKVEEEKEVLCLPPPSEESHARMPSLPDEVAGGQRSTASLKMEVKEELPSGETRIWSQEMVIATSSDVKAESEPSMPGGVRRAHQMSVADVALVKVES